MASSNDHVFVSTKKSRSRDGHKRRRSKNDRRREKPKRSKRKHDSYSMTSSSSIRVSESSRLASHAPRMSLATYKEQLPPLSSKDRAMNELCTQLGLEGGEYRDGYYVRYIEVHEDGKPKVHSKDKSSWQKDVDSFGSKDDRRESLTNKVETVEVPKEVIRYVPKINPRRVAVAVPGKVVDTPIPYEVPSHQYRPTFYDKEQEVVVAQILKPHINVNKGKSQHVEAYTIDPVMYPVDVYVPFPVQSCLKLTSKSETVHSKVDIPDGHYNTLVNSLNDTVPDNFRSELFKTKKGKKGRAYIPMMPPTQAEHFGHSKRGVLP
eukprot:GHVH01011126.1.p1 GENE.GHVH01011126.1~~GHVH01011126.1.p1  ORF type:complete len:320 (+),score=38.65 GHVH01011126.1:240-1199(+)